MASGDVRIKGNEVDGEADEFPIGSEGKVSTCRLTRSMARDVHSGMRLKRDVDRCGSGSCICCSVSTIWLPCIWLQRFLKCREGKSEPDQFQSHKIQQYLSIVLLDCTRSQIPDPRTLEAYISFDAVVCIVVTLSFIDSMHVKSANACS